MADYGAGIGRKTITTTGSSTQQRKTVKTMPQEDQERSVAAGTVSTASTALPKCFCNWKNCRSYQKSFRELKHTIWNGVVKLKFTKHDPKSMALKRAVDRTLHIDATKRNEWRPAPAADGGGEFVRYYIARHHFTEPHMKKFLSDRRNWDWNEPLTAVEAKQYLFLLDKEDQYFPDEDDDVDDDDDDSSRATTYYVQCPNVPKDQVREQIRRLKMGDGSDHSPNPAPTKNKKKKSAAASSGGGSRANASVHTQSTLSTSVTDTLKAFEDIIGHGEPIGGNTNHSVELLARKEQENLILRKELNDCQEQLSMLHSIVQKLKDDMDRSRSKPAPAPAPAKGKNRRNKKVQRQNSGGSTSKSFPQEIELTEDEDEDWSQDDEEDEEDEDEEDEEDEEEEEEEWSEDGGRHHLDDDDETISTFHVNSGGNRSYPRHGGRQSLRRGSQHSRRNDRSTVRRDSVHSRRESIHSRRDSIHSRSRHSRRSMRGGMADDAASVVSRQSLQSVSPSIKSLPREIQLMEEEEQETGKRGDDDYSFFDDSFRRPDDDARSVGSRSAASRASRRSIVSGARSRGRNSRVGRKSSRGGRNKGGGSSVPREIDLSGDELEDETYANVSTDTQFVTAKNIVDPYGEKGVYSGALSKSTGMPNGKGRLEYEKEGRWYEGDWIHGRWTGHGRLSNGDGDFYEGGLKNDHKHGTGVMKFADGRVFEGEYIRGQMYQGKMTYQDGSVYGGSWIDGMRHGRGKCVFVDGSEYEGEFREGNFHGHGKMTWNDGGWYVGEWCDGEMHGRGKEIRPDGSLRHDGEWSRGQPIRSANDSHQRKRRTNGVEVK